MNKEVFIMTNEEQQTQILQQLQQINQRLANIEHELDEFKQADKLLAKKVDRVDDFIRGMEET